ncbi:major facilitator superfamily domain-containing protein 3-like [Amphiura filiformis]|uniref:major facilitator superfamily domain-containing protein 3-like n=1 Tax=Amphiura filiformis TaxID=82378 RepID=UPI003B221596
MGMDGIRDGITLHKMTYQTSLIPIHQPAMLSAITVSKIGTLLLLYLVQGIPYGFQSRFLPIYLRTQGMSLTNLGFFKILLIPWALKVFWAPLIDNYASKRFWLLASLGCLATSCAMATAITPDHTTSLCIIVFCLNLFASTQDIAVDGIAIQILTPEELGAGNTVQVVGYKIGAIFGGGVLVWLIEYTGWSGLFVILAAFYVVTLLASMQIKQLDVEPNITKSDLTLKADKETVDTFDDLGLDGLNNDAKLHDYQLRSRTKLERKILNESKEIVRAQEMVKKTTTETKLKAENIDDNIYDDLQNTRNYQLRKRAKGGRKYSDEDDEIENAQEIMKKTNTEAKFKAENRYDDTYDELHENCDSERTIEFHDYQLRKRTDLERKRSDECDVIEGTQEMMCPVCKTNGITMCSCKDFGMPPSRFSSLLPLWVTNILSIPYSLWTICYVVFYKLGEQGAVGMFPLFLVDHGISATDVTMWTGVIGQGLSITGSLFGGWLLTSKRLSPLQVLPVLFGLRLIPMSLETILIGLSGYSSLSSYGLCIGSMCLLQLIGGAITTATFTLMMQCSQSAPDHIQATHYTALATLEVMGKLSLMAVIGFVTDAVGYFVVFCLFIGLSLLVFPLLKIRKQPQYGKRVP